MAAADKADIVRDLFAAYMANDRKAVENSFTEDFRFTTPHDDEIDKATYFERCWKVSDWIARQNLERIFADGDGAFVTYHASRKTGTAFATPSSSRSMAIKSSASTSISARLTRAASSSSNRDKDTGHGSSWADSVNAEPSRGDHAQTKQWSDMTIRRNVSPL
jgi:hypothetical protein